MSTNVAIVILAAGKSSRMGSPKQLLKWNDTTVLGHSIQQATLSKANKVYVVLGANQERIQKEVDCSAVEVLVNEHWDEGLGSSIACAAKHLLGTDLDGMMIVLADQPQFEASYYDEVINLFSEGDEQIVATDYGVKAGVPALFDRCYFERLAVLEGDAGAGKMIKEFVDRVTSVRPGFEVLDIDTPDDYRGLLGQNEEKEQNLQSSS